VTVAAEARGRGARAADDRESRRRDRDADQTGGTLLGNARDSEGEGHQADEDDQDHPGARKPPD
jgi:hypothetical protein